MTQTIDQAPGKAAVNVSGPDLVAIKARQRAMWASGDFAVIGTTLQIVGESLCEAAEVSAGSRVLDVACGNVTRRWPLLADSVTRRVSTTCRSSSVEPASELRRIA